MNIDSEIKLTLGGDVNFSRHFGEISGFVIREKPSLFKRLQRKLIKKIVKGSFNPAYDGAFGIKKIYLKEYDQEWTDPEGHVFYDTGDPFRDIGHFFIDSDAGFVNLETPLTVMGRHLGAFRSSPHYAQALRDNNIQIVSVANNHAFDAGEVGFEDTLHNLEINGIYYCGGGKRLSDIKNGTIIKIKSLKCGFLACTSLCNSAFISLATDNQSGIAPLHENSVLSDVKRIKEKSDFVIVAPHFDIENSSEISKNSIKLCRKMVDAGADMIIGSHSHIPKPIEIYKNKLIIYSLGNLIFTYSKRTWGNNLVAEVYLTNSGQYKCNAPL